MSGSAWPETRGSRSAVGQATTTLTPASKSAARSPARPTATFAVDGTKTKKKTMMMKMRTNWNVVMNRDWC